MGLKRKKLKYSAILVESDYERMKEAEVLAKKYKSIQLLAVTSYAMEAYHLVKTQTPDILIVDIHLKEGDGLELIRKLCEHEDMTTRVPYIVVVTDNSSPITKDVVANFADFVYPKNEDYQIATLFQDLLFICENIDKKSVWTSSLDSIDFLKAKEKHIRDSIDLELNQYKFDSTQEKNKMLVHEVLFEAVQVSAEKKLLMTSLYESVKKRYGIFESNGARYHIEKNLEKFISEAFNNTNPEVLSKVYPPYTRILPTAKEFVTFIADKIKKENGYDW